MKKIETAVQWMIAIAKDDRHGYDQEYRWGCPDYDCSSLVISAWEYAGIPVRSSGATYTGNLKSAFLANGFSDVTSQVHLSDGSGLKRGDILLNIKHHTVLYIGSEKVVTASQNESGRYHGGKPGDQTGKEIYIRSYYNYPWDCVLRYTADDSDAGTLPDSFGNPYVRQGQISASYFISANLSVTGMRDAYTKKAEIKVLQKAMNLDYGADLDIDGLWGPAAEAALGRHYVKFGESQYMVTACQILLLTHGLNPNGVEYPGIFGFECMAAVKKFQTDNQLPVTGICDKSTFLRLIK